jgi:kynureninase
VPPPDAPANGGAGERGHFLTFRLPEAAAVHLALHAAAVITDYRDDRLRIGFGLYHDEADVDELLRRLETIPGWP